MSAARAFLSQVKVIIEIDRTVGAGIDAALAAGALDWVDDNHSIFSLVNGLRFAGVYAGSIVAMVTHQSHISYLYPGYLASDSFRQLQPELSGIRLGSGIRSPIISDMLIFASNLAVIAAIAYRNIMNKNFQLIYLLQ